MFKRHHVGPLTLLLMLLLLLSMFLPDQGRAQDFPAGFTVEDTYQPGVGKPVAKVISSTGKSAVYHQEQTIAFWLKTDTPLFNGDTVITLNNAGIELGFIDASRLSIGPDAQLVINSTLYDEDARERSSFLSLIRGQARSWVKKLVNFRRSEFRVKTNTSIAGVRGSDFITWSEPRFTQVTSFERTVIEVISLSNPEKPILLHEFETIRDEIGKGLSAPQPIDLATANAMKNALPFSDTLPLGSPVTFGAPGKETAILIPEDQLVPPDNDFTTGLDQDQPRIAPDTLGNIKDASQQVIDTRFEEKLDDKHWDDAGFPAPPK